MFFNYKIGVNIMDFTNSCQNERGIVLIVSLVFLVLLALAGMTAVTTTTTDMQIGISHGESKKALIDADTGVNYAIAQMDAGFKAGTFPLPSAIGGTSNLTSSSFTPPPTGFNFEYNPTTLTKIGKNRYTFTTFGSSTNDSTATINSIATIVVTCQQRPAITMAAFGDEKLELKLGAVIKSFKSNSADPTKNDPDHASYDSTHEGDVGSNEELLAHAGSDIDGRGVLGEDTSENDAWNRIADPTDFYDEAPVDDENIYFDPLGMFPTSDGYNPIYDPTEYSDSASNDNCPAAGGNCVDIVGDACTDLCDNDRIYLQSAATADHMKLTAGDYYLTGNKAFNMAGGTTLTIDASGTDEVRLFVDGEPITVGAANIEILGGDSSNFSIFANTNQGLTFGNSVDFTAFIYAPLGDIDLNNGGTFEGALWGSQVDVKNGGTLFYDAALADKFLSKDIEIVTWQDFRF
jgi:hypothetical protein